MLEGQDLSEEVRAWVDEVIARIVAHFTESEYAEEWDLEGLVKAMDATYVQPPDEPISVDELREDVGLAYARDADRGLHRGGAGAYAAKEEELGAELMRELERFIILQVVDTRWREHLENMDYLREGVHLRAMAQKDPLVEYTAEGHVMFEELNVTIREEVVNHLFHAQIEPQDADELQRLQEAQAAEAAGLAYEHESARRRTSDRRSSRGGRRQRRLGDRTAACSPAAARSLRRARSPTRRRSAATTPAGAAPARSSRSATALSARPPRPPSSRASRVRALPLEQAARPHAFVP